MGGAGLRRNERRKSGERSGRPPYGGRRSGRSFSSSAKVRTTGRQTPAETTGSGQLTRLLAGSVINTKSGKSNFLAPPGNASHRIAAVLQAGRTDRGPRERAREPKGVVADVETGIAGDRYRRCVTLRRFATAARRPSCPLWSEEPGSPPRPSSLRGGRGRYGADPPAGCSSEPRRTAIDPAPAGRSATHGPPRARRRRGYGHGGRPCRSTYRRWPNSPWEVRRRTGASACGRNPAREAMAEAARTARS